MGGRKGCREGCGSGAGRHSSYFLLPGFRVQDNSARRDDELWYTHSDNAISIDHMFAIYDFTLHAFEERRHRTNNVPKRRHGDRRRRENPENVLHVLRLFVMLLLLAVHVRMITFN